MPKVSVVVPAYNTEGYIEECLQSLHAQTFTDFEVLCIDDASHDSTLARARAVVGADQRFEFHAAPTNRGLSATRNWGIDHAQGEYLVFLDSDDVLASCALEHLVARADAQQLDDLFFSASTFYENDAARAAHSEVFAPRPDCPQAMSGRALFEWFIDCGGLWPQAPYHMVRRSLLHDAHIRFYEGILHEDELYTVQTLCAAERAGYLNEELYQRRIRQDSIMTTPRSIRNVAGVFCVLVQLRAWMHQHAHECSDSFVRAYATNMASLQGTMLRDALSLDAESLDAFAATLPADERLDFLLATGGAAAYARSIEQEFLTSKTYRLGDVLLRLPRKVRDVRTRSHAKGKGSN